MIGEKERGEGERGEDPEERGEEGDPEDMSGEEERVSLAQKALREELELERWERRGIFWLGV